MGNCKSVPRYTDTTRKNTKSSSKRNVKRNSCTQKRNNNTNSSFEQIYFNNKLAVWKEITQSFKESEKIRDVFFFSEDEGTVGVLVSRPVLRWFDSHWDSIMSFCEKELSTNKARLRFRTVEQPDEYSQEEENISENENENIPEEENFPTTPSPRFSPFVTYERIVALCIRKDGLIEGFMLLEKGWRDDIELDVICTGPKKKGIGKVLITKLKEFTTKQGLTSITLTAVPNAIPFYEKQGFIVVRQRGVRDDAEMIWKVV